MKWLLVAAGLFLGGLACGTTTSASVDRPKTAVVSMADHYGFSWTVYKSPITGHCYEAQDFSGGRRATLFSTHPVECPEVAE